MNTSDTNRISHRQLYRQICLSFTAPFLLCLFGRDRLFGRMGIAGTLAAVLLLCFYVIFLVRLAPHYAELGKPRSRLLGWLTGIHILIYVTVTAAYLLFILENIVPVSLLEGVGGRWITLFAALACGLGTEKGMQRRARLAEVSAGIFLGSVALMMLLSLGQARMDYFRELGSSEASMEGFFKSTYLYLCAFSGIGLLPFALCDAKKQGSSWKPVLFGILTVGGVMAGMQLLLPAVFGEKRLLKEPYPVLPLLAGADLPGNVLARFDVLWMGFVLFGMFFSLGSLFHYGNQAIGVMLRAQTRFQPLVLVAAAWLLSFLRIAGYGISEYYPGYLAAVFVPVLLLIQLCLLIRPVKKRRLGQALAFAGVFCLLTAVGGCAGIDPEKRLYPLAMGIDKTDETYRFSYGIPLLPQATGQSSPEEDGSCLSITGKTFQEIEEAYDRTQEKYLDMGHLQVLLLGKGILESGDWDLVFDYLKREPMLGENIYLFYAADPEKILDWQAKSGTSVGEYLVGILENRADKAGTPGVTLRQAYYRFYEDGGLTELPRVRRKGDVLSIDGL